jgi:hypothetical protein
MQIKNIHLFIFCVVFSIVQFWFGIGGIGLEFKGSWILMAPFRPYFLNWLLLMAAVFLARRAKNSYGAIIFVLVIFLHYAFTISYVVEEINSFRVSPTEAEGLGHLLVRYPEELVWGAVTYGLGNLFIWALFLRTMLLRRKYLSGTIPER